MSKHTPGPWVYALYEQGMKVTTVAHCERFAIGLSSSIPGGNYRDGDPSGDPEADARLIAAAPDLLGCLKWLNRVGGLGLDTHARISAAIAKAEAA